MTVKLIHSTKDGDDLIAYMARVSNPNNQNNTETSDKLIKYLIKHKHWSPFEMVNMCVEIETTRSISAQILRHRSFSFQEFSQRYADVSAGLGMPDIPRLREQDTKNRQNSTDTLDDAVRLSFEQQVVHLFTDAQDLYKRMLEAGVAKECAREVLPMASKTRLYMNGTLRSWIHYIDLRASSGTQSEHRVIAEQCKELVRECFPKTYQAVWNDDHG
jgi:thymidylate synthase (FAD)